MELNWLAPTSIGRMLADYVAAVFVPGRVVGIFALAGPSSGDRYDEAAHAAAVPIGSELTALRLTAAPASPSAGAAFSARVRALGRARYAPTG